MMKKVITPLIAMMWVLTVSAQDQVLPVGEVKKISVSGNQLNLITTHAHVKVQVYSPNIIRVRMSTQPLADDFSYAVVASPQAATIKPVQTNQEIRFTTDSLQVVIRKNPFHISFYTPDNRLINEDEPGLGTSWIGTEVTTYKHMQPGERFIGLGEKTGNLDRKGSAYTNWNTDVFGYSASQDPLYSTIPFYIGIHQGLNYGIFFDNSYQSDFNFGASNNRFSSFSARGGEMNYYFLYHTHVAGLLSSYTQLTGRMNMPPLWSLGYQQNRYSYYPDTEVYRIAQTLREKKIPADGITLDIHYMDNYKLFTWNKERFPDPQQLVDSLNKMGFKVTLIVDPGIKVEKDYPAYESGLANDIFLKYADGQPYTGEVWPGWCHFPDFTSVKGRNWWKGQVTNYTNIGVEGIWNDMNEIATWGQKMPSNVLFDYDGHPTTHLKGHNVFGLQMARSSYEASRLALKKRPFILTRAGYAGLQRYTALWTGDNRAEDDHMLAGVRLLSSLGLSGVAFSAMDIGGFTGNPSTALYNRWMQLGTFTPYFRNHTQLNTKSAEPWTFGEEALEQARNSINLRYRLLPYIYSTFHEATVSGLPVVRSLAIDYTHDAHIYEPAFQNQFFFGPAILVMPMETTQQYAKVYLPAGDWYQFYTGQQEQGGSDKLIPLSPVLLPVYVKGGSIIPMQQVIQHTRQQPADTLLVHIYKGSTPNSFDYYEDDGETYRYEQGDFYKRTIAFDPAGRSIRFQPPTGSHPSKFRHLKLILHGFEKSGWQLNGQLVQPQQELSSFTEEKITTSTAVSEEVLTIVLENKAQAIRVSY
ncbi:MAG: glycoside hydrolase family 31 protein [Candidatus Pseudobacter hemicellulosilyticus]|uniref:Glycoside hydrolase family 31 protein n=1 Tax=Candidatus Pseudobacter hemicellulosilyticus TaxID=3121375 RepID=A0AAJ5WUR8_9BACT|nr:MAG: glycoside hydrolase family 31 protein [Pseudobacter sp.]